MPTIKAILQDAYMRLDAVSSSPRLDAQLLLAEALQVSRAHVLAHQERDLTADEAAHIANWIDRRANGEPVAYILGRRAFYDREFTVSADVLIPRPETEHLIEAALAFINGRALHAVDVGTGSGAIAITVKGNVPETTMYAIDISEAALRVAQANAQTQTIDVNFIQGDLLTPLVERGVAVDLVMANLPYIKTDVLRTLSVKDYEPELALDGGDDGLDLITRLVEQVPLVCKPGGLLLLEIGADQGEAVKALVEERLSAKQIDIIHDLAGLDRIVRIQL